MCGKHQIYLEVRTIFFFSVCPPDMIRNIPIFIHDMQARFYITYLIWSRTEDEQIKGNGRHHVNEKPAFEVMDSNLCWMAHYLIIDVDVCGAEINDDVHDKHDVHNKVNNVKWVTCVAAVSKFLLLLFIEEEGSWVRGEDRCVDDQQQN